MRFSTILFDFDDIDPGWRTVTDGVMGGVSTSLVSIDPAAGRLTFSGELSLENNGGFASIRSSPTSYDLHEYDGISLRVRGDGKSYRFRIRTQKNKSSISYSKCFETEPNTWLEILFLFSEMTPMYRGNVVGDVGSLDPASILSFGMTVADKQQGSFQLEVERISAVMIKKTEQGRSTADTG